MSSFIRKLSRLTGVALLAALSWSSHAQGQYPSKPITMIIAYAPGGGTDLVGRLIAPYIEKYLGNNARIIVSNKAGAGGGIGSGLCALLSADRG